MDTRDLTFVIPTYRLRDVGDTVTGLVIYFSAGMVILRGTLL
jgi:hypothetical protein